MSALLAVVAEAGHLTAALTEWPTAPVRGLAHVLTADGLGLLAATLYFGHSRVEPVLGIALTLTVPTVWFTGAIAGFSLYQAFPLLAAIAVTSVELGAALLLAMRLSVDSQR